MKQSIHNLILSGGVAHEYQVTSRIISEILVKGNIDSEITEDLSILESSRLLEFDLLTLNCVRWSCQQTPDWKDWAFTIGPEQQKGLLRFLGIGKGMMALHAAVINFDTWPEYREILGGYWSWGESSHGPYRSGYRMHIVDGHHPITEQIGDFSIHDELYHSLHFTKLVHPLVITIWGEKIQPVAWTTEYGVTRIYYCALGHGIESFRSEEFKRLLLRGALWSSREI